MDRKKAVENHNEHALQNFRQTVQSNLTELDARTCRLGQEHSKFCQDLNDDLGMKFSVFQFDLPIINCVYLHVSVNEFLGIAGFINVGKLLEKRIKESNCLTEVITLLVNTQTSHCSTLEKMFIDHAQENLKWSKDSIDFSRSFKVSFRIVFRVQLCKIVNISSFRMNS